MPKKEKSDEPRSLVRRMLEPLFGRSEQAKQQAEGASKGRARRAFRARIALRRGRELVIVVRVDADFDWTALPSAEVVLRDGKHRSARIVASPKAGTVPAGTEMRLILDVDGGADAELAHLELGDVTIILDAA